MKISGTKIDRTDEITYKWAVARLHASEPGFYDCSKPKELVLSKTKPEVCFELTPKSQKQFDANFCVAFWSSSDTQQVEVEKSSLNDSSASFLLF